MSSKTKLVLVLIGIAGVCTWAFFYGGKESSFSGMVELDGVPITRGRLIVTPDQEKGNRGKRILCDIREGQFEFLVSDEITPGPNVALVTVHPIPDKDGKVTLEQLAQSPMFMVDIEVPSEKSFDFLITVHRDRSKNKQTRRKGHRPETGADKPVSDETGEKSTNETPAGDDAKQAAPK